mgnify:CR=1 FL=1
MDDTPDHMYTPARISVCPDFNTVKALNNVILTY